MQCKHGHTIDNNIYVYPSGRKVCRECRHNWAANHRAWYTKTDEYKKIHREGQKRYLAKAPQKELAHRLAKLNKDKIRKDSCETCGNKQNLHMHHPDYLRPLDVITLCIKCHEDLHHKKGTIS